MLKMQAINYLRLPRLSRRFSTSLVKQQTNATKDTKTTNNAPERSVLGAHTYRPNDFDKLVLVWTKRYRSRDEIPHLVTTSTITESRSKARIKVCNYLLVITAIYCAFTIYMGKDIGLVPEDRTDGVDFHKQISQDFAKSLRKNENDS